MLAARSWLSVTVWLLHPRSAPLQEQEPRSLLIHEQETNKKETVVSEVDLLPGESPTEAAIRTQIAELKEHIGDQAMALAKEHGWCSETEEALREMGIDPNVRIGGEVTVKFRVSAELMSRISGGTPLLVDNPARYLKENIVPKLQGAVRSGLRISDEDVSIMEVQVNRVSKTRKGA